MILITVVVLNAGVQYLKRIKAEYPEIPYEQNGLWQRHDFHLTGLMFVCTTGPMFAAENDPPDSELQLFFGEAKFEKQQLFEGERFPNVVVPRDGTVLANWGSQRVRVRRSEDGGETWGPKILVGKGIHGGGAIVIAVPRDKEPSDDN